MEVRIFISSPGDVADERDRARSVVEALRRRYAGRLDLSAVLWEELPLEADQSFQQGIDLVVSECGVDIAVFILWSRLGSPLGALVRKPDGAEYRSGTEREWDLMLRAREQSGSERPSIIVYTRTDESSFDERLRGLPTEEKVRVVQQKKLVEEFIKEEFHDTVGGTNRRAYHSFDRPNAFAKLLRIHLQEMLDGLAGAGLSVPIWDMERQGPPFLGLDAFERAHAPVFFGREDEIVAIRQLLREQARRGCAFVLITGASGSGKSSLARAGILPAVADYEIDSDIGAWRSAVLTPAGETGDPLRSLATALTAKESLPTLEHTADALARLAADLARDPELIVRRLILPALSAGGQSQRLFVLVDQFEELFTDPRITVESREKLISALESLARSGAVWVLATVRSDFYAQCQSLAPLVRMKEGGGQFDLLAPGADALDRLIRQPATLAGLRFEQRDDTSLADVILRDATSHRELLPLLEYLLHRLCAARTAEGVLTFASYEALGGVEGALAHRAAAVIDELHPPEAALEALLAALVTLSGDEQESFVRRHVLRTELERDDASRALVARLIHERLLTTSAMPGGPAVTVAHEALFRVWPVAVAWLRKNREFLRLRVGAASNCARWQNEGEHISLLLPPGLLMEEATRLLAIEAGRLEGSTRRYIEVSIAHHRALEKRRRRQRRVIFAALSALMLLAVGAAIFAWRAVLEQRKQLHAASMADYAVAVQRIERDGKWNEGVAHLTRALELEPGNVLAAQRLYYALYFYASENQNWPHQFLRHESEVWEAQWSPDGTRILTSGNDTAQVWDAAGRALGAPLRHGRARQIPQWSPDGTRVLTSSNDTAQVWDATSGKERGSPIRPTSKVWKAYWSPDGTRIFTAGHDGSAQVWDAASGMILGAPVRHESVVGFAQWSPDGTRIFAVCRSDAKVFNAASGKPLGAALRHEGIAWEAQWSPDGTRIVTWSSPEKVDALSAAIVC